MSYEPTPDEDIVKKVTETLIDLSVYIERYKGLKKEYQAIPDLKTTPDQETLDFFNQEREIENQSLEQGIRVSAEVLYNDLTPIVDAGLLPAKYQDEYDELEQFINS